MAIDGLSMTRAKHMKRSYTVIPMGRPDGQRTVVEGKDIVRLVPMEPADPRATA